MDNIFGMVDKYYDICVCLMDKSMNKTDLVKEAMGRGLSDSTVKNRVREVFSNQVDFINIVGSRAVLDKARLEKEISNGLLELEGHESDDSEQRRVADVDNEPSILDMKKAYDEAQKRIKELEKENRVLKEGVDAELSQIILASMDSKILVPATVTSAPDVILGNDFFYDNPGDYIDAMPLARKSGGVLEEIYKVKDEPEKEFTEKNYFKRLFRQFKDGKLYQQILKDENGVIKDRHLSYDLDENRKETIKHLILDSGMTNQTKLGMYACMFWSNDCEMKELLNYAVEHAINAEAVIMLLEMPEELRNYAAMREHLRSLRNPSEAHIKKETIQELLCGDWQVVADYCGERCHFRLFPVEELQAYYNLLKDRKFDEANRKLGKLLSPTFVQVEQKS